jgi:hypothetical protein
MSWAIRIPDADRINFLNIGLMLISCVVALFIPFELFLFAYAVLGPAHYFTEISWLQKRHFFTKGKHDPWILYALGALVCLVAPWSPMTATFTFLALGCALVLVLTDKGMPRILGLVPVIVLAIALVDSTGFLTVLLGVFVPTLIHVYLFTGSFMLYGALKERSRSGYVAFGVFLLCPLACWFIDPGKFAPSIQAINSYWNNFSILNLTILGVNAPHTTAEARDAVAHVFYSPTGLIIMRFIAFAYTYHYLNWFSKTSIIRWHEMGVKRLVVISALWLASIVIYLYDFALGFKILFYLSITHVYLEFPLNHVSIIGTFREVRSLMGRPMEPALAGSLKSRK